MFQFPNVDKKVIIILGLMLCFIFGFCIERLYQPRQKTIKIYSQALSDYNDKNYSNAYYLFSRVGRYSKLKPAALYRQALCAKALGDEKSELLSYHEIFRRFPTSHLNIDAKYKSAQILWNQNPQKARKYFNEILLSNANEEYKTASEYFISKINALYFPSEYSKSDIEKGFRNYLAKYPDGKFSLDTAESWEEFNPDMDAKDKILIARTYYNYENYDKVEKILAAVEIKDCWPILGLNLFKQNKNLDAKNLILTGVTNYSKYADRKDYKNAVYSYILNSSNYFQASDELFSMAKGENKDIIWNYRCKYTQNANKYSCYENLYSAYPKSDYAQEAMLNVLLGSIISKNYDKARVIAENFMLKYPDSENLPFVMFWRAKTEQIFGYNPNYESFYRDIIESYPDSYYAYRAFSIINHFKSALIKSNIENKPVVYPYKYPARNSTMHYLLLVDDYDILEKYAQDEFISAWADYQNGNYAKSMHRAKKAMDSLKPKPPKSDLRWRLVYPIHYYDQIMNSTSQNENSILLLSLIKEESSFNPEAQSEVGALGLMQLMPQTAHETWKKEFDTYDLLDPEFNIKVGSLYYENLKRSLNNNDILSVASYNGGIGSVNRWLKNLYYSDIDEFIEQIPYDETKNYIKKVFKSYWNYIRIYG